MLCVVEVKLYAHFSNPLEFEVDPLVKRCLNFKGADFFVLFSTLSLKFKFKFKVPKRKIIPFVPKGVPTYPL